MVWPDHLVRPCVTVILHNEIMGACNTLTFAMYFCTVLAIKSWEKARNSH